MHPEPSEDPPLYLVGAGPVYSAALRRGSRRGGGVEGVSLGRYLGFRALHEFLGLRV